MWVKKQRNSGVMGVAKTLTSENIVCPVKVPHKKTFALISFHFISFRFLKLKFFDVNSFFLRYSVFL